MRYIVYKTTNLINQKYYYGVHLERRASDGYIGCGVCSNGTARNLKKKGANSAFIDAVIKYGYENFKREILKEFDNRIDAFAYEAELVTEEVINNKNCYNCKIGGVGASLKFMCKEISLYDVQEKKIIKFNSIQEAADFADVKRTNITKILKNKNNLSIIKKRYKIADCLYPIKVKDIHGNIYDYQDIESFCHDYKFPRNYVLRLVTGQRNKLFKFFRIDYDLSKIHCNTRKRAYVRDEKFNKILEVTS
jgi:hypothetical protein